MSFLFLMLAFSILTYLPQSLFGDRWDYRMTLRHGMAGGFTFTGVDHFVNAQTRYVPMMPDSVDRNSMFFASLPTNLLPSSQIKVAVFSPFRQALDPSLPSQR